MIGSEVLQWGEENGDSNVMGKIIPRATLEEGRCRVILKDQICGTELADPRMQHWPNKLASNGIEASEIQLFW